MWLTGDFHAHSTCSDGVLPPRRFIEEAEREQLDFFAITDHNTWAYPHFIDSDEVLVIPGIEVTMPYGHFNVFSVEATEPDWVDDLGDQATPVEREDQKGRSGELVERIGGSGLRASINHPLLFPWEWTDPDAPLSGFDYLEVWNDPTWPENRLANPAALDMWTRWLNAGLRITAIGGSDFHNPEKMERFDGLMVDGHRVGIPRSWVLADAATPQAILDAIDRHRVYVTMGPTIELAASGPAGERGIGEDLGSATDPIVISAQTRGPGDLRLELVRNGAVIASSEGRSPGLEESVDPDPGRGGWLRVDVRDWTGEVVAFTNPVWYGPAVSGTQHDYGTFTEISTALAIQEQWQEATQHRKEGST